ncbi:MAG: hypothetical protein WBW88_19475, partial [Rhodothermales bacterium]
MNRLDHFAEPFPPTGTVTSEGVLNQLGRPHMGPIEVLVRETVQNCWDAKLPGADQVRVSFEFIELSHSARELVSETLFASLPPDETSSDLRRVHRLLLISDRGTTGLGGVLRANEDGEDQPRDFVDFLRNVGQPPDHEYGGGTYGFGKVALYLASQLRSIIVHTRCQHAGTLQSRFMAARLGGQYRQRGHRYTGRHWWGRFGPDGVIDPVLGPDADWLAEELGFPGFANGELGTTLAIVEPALGTLDDRHLMEVIAEAVAWNFWPKMVSLGGALPVMQFSVKAADGVIPIPFVDSDPVLGAFSTAFRTLKTSSEGEDLVEAAHMRTVKIECQRPVRFLGRLSLRKIPAAVGQEDAVPTTAQLELDGEQPGLRGRIHHTALLRVPELVVKYVPGPESSTPLADYVGVFLADAELDRVFAESEPPTHDDWVPDGLEERQHRTFVRVGLRRIIEAMRDFSGAVQTQTEGASGIALGGLAEKLSGLFPGAPGTGARVQPSGPGPSTGGGQRRPRVQIEGEPVLHWMDDQPVMSVACKVSIPDGFG